MNNYFITNDDINKIVKSVKTIASGKPQLVSGQTIPNKDANKYIVGMLNNIKQNHESVTVLTNITNDQYDDLLKCNVVFINLVDASAVNTVLECIVRNTPILVNRLPATEEYLGRNYPLFYHDISDCYKLLSDSNIYRAHKYLCRLDKNHYSIDNFIIKLTKSRLYQKI